MKREKIYGEIKRGFLDESRTLNHYSHGAILMATVGGRQMPFLRN